MKWGCSVLGVAKADFLQRVRHFSFVSFCALTVFFTFWFVPRPMGFTALVIDPDLFKQGSDPSWIPMSAAMCGGMMLCLFGFVYILSAVRHDRDSGVLALLRTSPTLRGAYLFGKLLADTALLLSLIASMMAAAFLIMEIRFPGQLLSPWDFFSPFLAVVPGLLFVSAFALLMECAPVFRRKSGLSAALFFSLFVTLLVFASMNINPYRLVSILDFSGFLWMRQSISAAARSVTGHPLTQISIFTNSHVGGTHLKTLVFHGLLPSAPYLLDKLALLAASILLTLLASRLLPKTEKRPVASKHSPTSATAAAQPRMLTYRFSLIGSEFRKLIGPQSIFWWICAAVLWAACLFAPIDTVRDSLFALVFVWLMPVFSRMGCAEHQSGMGEILRTIPGANIRQALSCWRAGATISLIAAFPALIRFFYQTNAAGFLSALFFALLVPAAALFLGEYTASNRPFEILLLILVFLALNVPTLLIPNRFSAASDMHMAIIGCLTIIVLFLSFGKRSITLKVSAYSPVQ